MKNSFLLASACWLAVSVSSQALAQDDGTVDDGLQEIVVTAQKRSENVQNVPISVTALGSEAIAARHAADITALSGLSPNVRIEPLGIASTSAFFIRGSGTADPDSSFDSAVGLVIDGIFISRTLGAVIDTSDVQGVEILRGPQGTLFGKNTTGGLINVTYRKPGMEFGGDAGARFGNYDMVELKAGVDVPLIKDTLAVRASGQFQRRDGYFRSVINGENVGEQRTEGGRLVFLLAPPASAYDATLTLDYHHDGSGAPTNDNNATPGRNYPLCDGAGLCGDGSYKTISSNMSLLDIDLDTYMAALTQNLKLGDHTLTSVSGYRRLKSFVPFDPDSTAGRFVDALRREKTWQVSQELRITSPTDRALTYVAGLFFFKQKSDSDSFLDLADLLGGAFPFLLTTPTYSYAISSTRNFAAFAQADYHFNDRTWLTLGGRYAIEKKTMRETYQSDIANAVAAAAAQPGRLPPTFTGSLTSKNFSPRVVLNFRPAKEVLLFASWTRGFRSGGFNNRATNATEAAPFDDERVDSFELGIKSDLFDRKVRFNATAFLARTSNLQAERVFPDPNGFPATATLNAGTAVSKGIELEVAVQPTHGLRFDFTGGYIHARYTDFCGNINRGIHGDAVGLGITGCSAVDPAATNNTDLRLKSVPTWSGSASAEYEFGFTGGSTVTLRGDANFASKSYQDLQNSDLGIRRSYAILGASARWIDAADRYSISLFGRNLTDHRYVEAFNPGALAPLAFYNAPRTYGVELGFKF